MASVIRRKDGAAMTAGGHGSVWCEPAPGPRLVVTQLAPGSESRVRETHFCAYRVVAFMAGDGRRCMGWK